MNVVVRGAFETEELRLCAPVHYVNVVVSDENRRVKVVCTSTLCECGGERRPLKQKSLEGGDGDGDGGGGAYNMWCETVYPQ